MPPPGLRGRLADRAIRQMQQQGFLVLLRQPIGEELGDLRLSDAGAHSRPPRKVQAQSRQMVKTMSRVCGRRAGRSMGSLIGALEGLASALDSHLGCAHPDAETLGQLGVRQAFNVAQTQHLQGFGGQGLQRAGQALARDGRACACVTDWSSMLREQLLIPRRRPARRAAPSVECSCYRNS